MKGTIAIVNRQRTRPIDLRYLDRVVRAIMLEEAGEGPFEFGVTLVDDRLMAELNEEYLDHPGTTDVVSFNYAEPGGGFTLAEVIVCVPEAVRQSKVFRQHWTAELVRYIVHGWLHIRGFEDESPADYGRMRAEQERRLHRLAQQFDLRKVAARRPRKTQKKGLAPAPRRIRPRPPGK